MNLENSFFLGLVQTVCGCGIYVYSFTALRNLKPEKLKTKKTKQTKKLKTNL